VLVALNTVEDSSRLSWTKDHILNQHQFDSVPPLGVATRVEVLESNPAISTDKLQGLRNHAGAERSREAMDLHARKSGKDPVSCGWL
jgi:hypothetical protein